MKRENEELGVLLYQTFFYNHSAYAVQEKVDGEVCFLTKHERIDANKINYYIENKKSVLAYQQKFDKLNWVCLDFDIVKSILMEFNDYDFISDDKYRNMLLEEVEICCNYLIENNITYLTEYSGNRGIHIWILFEFPITKRLGYTIIEEIVEKTPFKYIHSIDSPIGIDLFPKVPSSKNNIVGKGVKIPISYHLKSDSYSYIINDFSKISRISVLSDELIEDQVESLKSIKRNDVRDVISNLEITEVSDLTEYKRIEVNLDAKLNGEEIISALCKSSLYKYLFNNLETLNENERRILVGTFCRIQYKGDNEYGLRLLKDIFATTENYDKDLTEIKIDLLKNLYPPNVKYVEKILNQKCGYCEENKIENVTDLLENITLRKADYLSDIVSWATLSEVNYLNYNDEVPLCFIEDELNQLDYTEIKERLSKILDEGNYNSSKAYKYVRNEGDKTRILYSLSGEDRVITTSLMKYIYDVIGVDTISPISYSYRINSNSRNMVFMSWNTLWMEFIKAVQGCADHKAYDDYYVIKLDIRGFYDSINLTLLKEIMTAKSREGLHSDFIKLSIESLSDEVKERYKNAVNYLIETSKDINLGKTTGVPQGPAYARYLAELYLASIDDFLMGKLDVYYDFACRYVDDYYIFVKDNEKGEVLKDSLINELNGIYLDINDKLKYGILSEIKYEIEIKNQVHKYFVDGIDTGTPDSVKFEAKKILNAMYKDFVKNDAIKDFPFFLTHLWDDDYLSSKSDALVKKLKATDVGRGSLFKHFYNRVATKYSNMDFYQEIGGLSRSNFITSLMRNDCVDFNSKQEYVETYLSLDLQEFERIELLRYVLLNGVDFNVDILTPQDYIFIVKLIESIPSIIWIGKLFSKTLNAIQDVPDKIKAIKVIKDLLTRSKNIPDTQKITEIIHAIIHENDFIDLSIQNTQNLYCVIAYATLFLSRFEQVKSIWTKLLSNRTDEIKSSEWLGFTSIINTDDIMSATVSSVLFQLFSNNSFMENKSAERLELEYAYYLFLELSNYSNSSDYINEGLFALVQEVAKEKNAVSLLWCCDNAEYFPEREIAAKNIEINERLVLIKGNEILVRGNKECFEQDDYEEEDWGESLHSCYKIYPIENTLMNFNDKISDYNLMEVLSYSYVIIQSIRRGNVNIFERGTLIEEGLALNYKYTKADKRFIVNKTETIDNNLESVIDRMIETISKSGCEYIFRITHNKIVDSQIKTDIIPYKFFSSHKVAKRTYFDRLCKSVNDYKKEKSINTLTIYELESFKLDALKSIISELEREIPNKIKGMNDCFKVLAVYNKFYKKNDQYLLYSRADEKIDNLKMRLDLLRDSIINNLDCTFVSELSFELDKLIIGFMNKFGELEKFSKVQARLTTSKGIIEIDGQRVLVNDLEVIYFDGIYNHNELDDDDLFELNIEDMYKSEEKIVILPTFFTRAYEIASNKDSSLDLINVIIDNEVKNYPLFNDAVEVIRAQSGGSISKGVAQKRIIDLLGGKESKYYASILKIISSHRVISEEEYEFFNNNLKGLLNRQQQISVIPLKDYKADRNGFDLILREKLYRDFGRSKEYDKKLSNSINSFFEGKQKSTIAIVSDVGISGQQLMSTIEDYLEQKGAYNSDKLYKYENDIFRANFCAANKVIILNCIYTDMYKSNVTEYIKNTFDIADIEFIGNEICIDSQCNYLQIHENDRSKLKEFVEVYNKELLTQKVYKKNTLTYKEYLAIPEKDVLTESDRCKSLMLLRYKSMPKFNHLLFRGTIFDYRVD